MREHKKHRRLRKTAVCSVAYESVLALTCSFCFLLAFHAGLFIMLALASLCQNTCASTLTFEPLQSAFQGFVFADAYLGHCYPSPRSFRLCSICSRRVQSRAYDDHMCIISLSGPCVNYQIFNSCKFCFNPANQGPLPPFARLDQGSGNAG